MPPTVIDTTNPAYLQALARLRAARGTMRGRLAFLKRMSQAQQRAFIERDPFMRVAVGLANELLKTIGAIDIDDAG